MSELKDRWFWAYPTESVDCDGITGSAHEVYSKSDVDASIDELKAAHHKERHEYIKMIAELKQKIEDAKASAYAESVDAGMENRRLKRALWLARADRAMMTLDYFTLKCRWFKYYMNVEPPKCDVKMIPKWANVERKCRAKAEEYDNGLG